MLQFSMKESSNNPIRIESFSCDDKTYVIIGYGGFIKNYHTAIDILLVNVQMVLVDNDCLIKNILTCIVGLLKPCSIYFSYNIVVYNQIV